MLKRQATEDDITHKLPSFRLPLHEDQPLKSRRNYPGLLHVLAWKGNIGDFLGEPVKIPLTWNMEGTGHVLNKIASILFVGKRLGGTEFGQMALLIDARDGSAENHSGDEAYEFHVWLVDPLLLDVVAVKM